MCECIVRARLSLELRAPLASLTDSPIVFAHSMATTPVPVATSRMLSPIAGRLTSNNLDAQGKKIPFVSVCS